MSRFSDVGLDRVVGVHTFILCPSGECVAEMEV